MSGLGNELWEEHFDSLLPLVKEYVVDVWEAQKIKLYGDDSSQSQSSTGDLVEFTGIEGQSGENVCQGGKIKDDFPRLSNASKRSNPFPSFSCNFNKKSARLLLYAEHSHNT